LSERSAMSATVEVRELTQRWAEVLRSVHRGEEVVIVDAAVPQARLLPIARRRAGLHADALQPQPGFDDPLPESYWTPEP
jgi:prevent-host-death family protein